MKTENTDYKLQTTNYSNLSNIDNNYNLIRSISCDKYQLLPISRYSVEPLPEHLVPIADQEYGRFLDRESRIPKDAVVSVQIQRSMTNSDETVASGSLGVRTGLNLAVPMYSRFKNAQEALDYFK